MGRPSDLQRLTATVRAVLDRHIPSSGRVVVGVSGGPDSVALLALVATARPDLEIVVGHVRHGLRPDAEDAVAADGAARRVDARSVELTAAVGPGRGPEDAARVARLAALCRLTTEQGADALLLGHTGDDQAETLLLRLARGTGVDGLAGMRERADRDGVALVRPLLGLRRAAVRAVVTGQPTVIDPTNADPDQRRARSRHDALPALGRLRPDGGDATEALMRLAGLADDSRVLLDHLTGPVHRIGMAVRVPDPTATHPTATHLTATHLTATHPGATHPTAAPPQVRSAWRARLLRKGWAALPQAPPPPSAAATATAIGLAPGDRVDLVGGVRIDRLPDGWVLRNLAHPRLPSQDVVLDAALVLPGHVHGWRVSRASDRAADHDAVLVGVGPEHVDRLVVRGRSASGDRAARRALSRWPRPLRDQVPLLCTADGEVLLVGHVVVSPPQPGRATLIVAEAPIGPSPRYPLAP